MAQNDVRIGIQVSSHIPGEPRVMIDANDLLVFFMCDIGETDHKEVVKYKIDLAMRIAKIIKDPIEL